MSFYELMIIMGVDPKIEPWKAYVWFFSVMFVGFVLFFGAFFAQSLLGKYWFLVLILIYVGIYISGHFYNIFDRRKRGSWLRAWGRFISEMFVFRVDREQPIGKFLLWQVAGFTAAGFLTLFVVRIWLDGGSPLWALIGIPFVLVFYVIGRHFGHYR